MTEYSTRMSRPLGRRSASRSAQKENSATGPSHQSNKQNRKSARFAEMKHFDNKRQQPLTSNQRSRQPSKINSRVQQRGRKKNKTSNNNSRRNIRRQRRNTGPTRISSRSKPSAHRQRRQEKQILSETKNINSLMTKRKPVNRSSNYEVAPVPTFKNPRLVNNISQADKSVAIREDRNVISKVSINEEATREGPDVHRETPKRIAPKLPVKRTISDKIGDAVISINDAFVSAFVGCVLKNDTVEDAIFPFRCESDGDSTVTEPQSKTPANINKRRVPYDPSAKDFKVLTNELIDITNMIQNDEPCTSSDKLEVERLKNLAPNALWMYMNGERKSKAFTSDHIRSLLRLFCDEDTFAKKTTRSRKYLLAELDRINEENPDLLQVAARLYL